MPLASKARRCAHKRSLQQKNGSEGLAYAGEKDRKASQAKLESCTTRDALLVKVDFALVTHIIDSELEVSRNFTLTHDTFPPAENYYKRCVYASLSLILLIEA